MSQGTREALGTLTQHNEERITELEAVNTRLRGLVAELLFKNQQLRSASLADRLAGNSSDRFPRNLNASLRENNDDAI